MDSQNLANVPQSFIPTSSENYSMSINNKKIFDFYSKNKSLNFEDVNLMFVDILDKINSNPNLDNIMASQLLQNMSDMNNKIFDLTDTISKIQNDNLIKINLIHTNIENNIKHILSNNNNDKIAPMLKEFMQTYQDRTKIMFNDTIPKNNELISNTILLSEHRLKENLNEIKYISNANQDKSNKLSTDVNSLLNSMQSAPNKGKISECALETILNNLFPNAEINSVGKTKESADIVLKRETLHDIRFENKNFGKNIPTKEVQKFKRDMEIHSCSGIMLTQQFGISSKNNFEFEIFNGNVYVYLHNVNYCADKIKTAVDIIDHIKKEINNKEETIQREISINKDVFANINSEFIKLIEKRDNLINSIRKSNDKIISEVREIEFPALRDFININSGSTETKKFTCEFCGITPKKNNFRGLETHQRSCKDKKNKELLLLQTNNNPNSSEDVLDDEDDEDDEDSD